MKKNILFIICIIFIFSTMYSQKTLSPSEILEKIDKNMIYKTAYVEMDMEIKIKKRIITKSLISYSKGNDKSFIEFSSPARDKGTKMLRSENIVKIYYPSAERIMRLSGHMLRQSMMGSDFSYEDMTERSEKLMEEYDSKMLEAETIDGRVYYVLELNSKKEKKTYYKRKIWVDKNRFIGFKEELYSKGGKLLKTIKVIKVEKIDGRYYPMIIEMVDKLRKNSSTTMIIKSIKFDLKLPKGVFSERNLQKR